MTNSNVVFKLLVRWNSYSYCKCQKMRSKLFWSSPLKIFQNRVPPMLLKSIKGTSSLCGFGTGNIDHAKHKKYVEYCLNVEYSIHVTNIEYRTIPLSLHAFLDTTQVYQILIIPLWLWHGLAYQATFKSTPKSLKMLTKHHKMTIDRSLFQTGSEK